MGGPGRIVALAAVAVAGYFVVSNFITGDDTNPLTYDTCTEANAEAVEWQQRSMRAELDMDNLAATADQDNHYSDAESLFVKAMRMQDRIITGNPACFPPDALLTAMDSLGLTASDLPEGPPFGG